MTDVVIRPSKVSPAIYGWITLYVLVLSAFGVGVLIHGIPRNNLWAIVVFVFIGPAAYILAYRYYMRFPIVRIETGRLHVQTLWEKWSIPGEKIVRIVKNRGFLARPVLRGLLQSTRPYWRLEVHYLKDGAEEDVDIDLTLFHKEQTEKLLAALGHLRPDLQIPTIDSRGL